MCCRWMKPATHRGVVRSDINQNFCGASATHISVAVPHTANHVGLSPTEEQKKRKEQTERDIETNVRVAICSSHLGMVTKYTHYIHATLLQGHFPGDCGPSGSAFTILKDGI